MIQQRAYATFEVKSLDDDQRIIKGYASTPELDRQGDRMSSEGAKFALPLPLLWQHRHDQPIGQVLAATVTKSGIEITAQIAKGVLPRIDEAWALIKAGLVRGLSIGWLPLDATFIDGAFHVKSWEWLELSAVTVPANAAANITAIKSIDARDLAASGNGPRRVVRMSAGVSAKEVTGTRTMAKTITEQISGFEATRQAKSARMTEIMQKAGDDGLTLDAEQQEEYDGLEREVESIDHHLKRLSKLAEVNQRQAFEIKGNTFNEGTQSRGPMPVIGVKDNQLPGIGFARVFKVKAVARLDHRYALDVAKEMYPQDQRLHSHFEKATVSAGSTTNAVNAAALIDPVNLASEFIEFLRPETIIGKFGANGVPSLNRVPFNIRVTGRTTGGTGYWVGEGAPKPLTAFEYNATTLAYTKVAAISVITQELARFSSPSADMLTREGLRAALVERIDVDFVDPASSAVANVQPASITNGLTALSSAGTSADNARTDVQNLLEQFILTNQNVAGLVLIMPNTLALALSLMRNSLGNQEFPGLTLRGGTLEGIPVITSQYAANASGGGNLVIALNANEVFLADDGEVTIDASTEASLQMLDNPTNNSATGTPTTMVSMYQTNSIAIRAERFINWAKRRAQAVVYMDDVSWGSIGSPS